MESTTHRFNYINYFQNGGTVLYKGLDGEIYEGPAHSPTIIGSLLRAVQYAKQHKTPLFKMRKVTTNGVYDDPYADTYLDTYSHTYSPLGYLRYLWPSNSGDDVNHVKDVSVPSDSKSVDSDKSSNP